LRFLISREPPLLLSQNVKLSSLCLNIFTQLAYFKMNVFGFWFPNKSLHLSPKLQERGRGGERWRERGGREREIK
jgi:hypothetical protein